jgi:hypothetical protein
MRKRSILFLFICAFVLLTGCSKEKEKQVNAIVVDKDGGLQATIVESFDKDYYKEDELKSVVEEQIAAYNSQQEGKSVSLESLKVKEKNVELVMGYGSYQEYMDFNQSSIFNGSIADAMESGYTFDTVFHKVKKGKSEKEELTLDDIKSMSDYQVFILNEYASVEVPKNIVAISDNIDLAGKKEAQLKPQSTKETKSETVAKESVDESSDESTVHEEEMYTGEAGYIIYKN